MPAFLAFFCDLFCGAFECTALELRFTIGVALAGRMASVGPDLGGDDGGALPPSLWLATSRIHFFSTGVNSSFFRRSSTPSRISLISAVNI